MDKPESDYGLLKRLSDNPCDNCDSGTGCCGCQKASVYNEAVKMYKNSDIYKAAMAVRFINTTGDEIAVLQNQLKKECSYLREQGFDLKRIFGQETGYTGVMERQGQQPDGVVHSLKILCGFADDVLDGNKPFEIRYNDRNYQKDDFIKFSVIDAGGKRLRHSLNNELFKITYVLDGWGLEKGYVALGLVKS